MVQRRWYTADSLIIHEGDITVEERRRAVFPHERRSFFLLTGIGSGLREWQLAEMAAATGGPQSQLANQNSLREHLSQAFQRGQLVALRRLPEASTSGSEKEPGASPTGDTLGGIPKGPFVAVEGRVFKVIEPLGACADFSHPRSPWERGQSWKVLFTLQRGDRLRVSKIVHRVERDHTSQQAYEIVEGSVVHRAGHDVVDSKTYYLWIVYHGRKRVEPYVESKVVSTKTGPVQRVPQGTSTGTASPQKNALDAIVLATSTLELASRALEGGNGELAANILKDGAAELEKPTTAVSSSKKPILDAILSTMKARAAGYLQAAPRPLAEKAYELISLSKKVMTLGKGLKVYSEHARLLEEMATESLVHAEFLLHAAENTAVMIGSGVSQTYRAIVNACFEKRIEDSGTLNNLFTNHRDKLKADTKKMNEAFDYIDRKMQKAGLSFDHAWSVMFDEHHLASVKDLPSFPTEHDAAVFLRDHDVTHGLLMPISDLARSLCEGKMRDADAAAAEIIKILRKNDQWEIARALLDELSKNARTSQGSVLALELNASERREWWSQKAQQFVVDDLPVLILSGLISGGIGVGARTLALMAKWGPKAARGVQIAAELLSFVPTERVLNDVLNNRRADWSAYGMGRDYLLTAASFGLFYTLGVCWRAWRTPPKVVPDAVKTAATPKGMPKEIPATEKAPENITALKRENESAEILRENNYPVEHLPEVPGSKQPGVKRPDYRIGGILFDNYAPNTKNARSIWSVVEGKVKSQQARRIVVNLADSKVDLAALQKQFAEWPIDGLEQLLVLTRDKNILSFRLAKPFPKFTPKGYPDQRD